MRSTLIATAAALLLCIPVASYAFESGSTGADGPFSPIVNTVLDVPANGIFNFTSVNIPQGVTVAFKKNSTNMPVYILTTGDVMVAGTVSVNGESATGKFAGKGGPGGFDGGLGGDVGTEGGKGLGPGGGGPGLRTDLYANEGGGGGGYGSRGISGSDPWGNDNGGATYGNIVIIPQIGGSGGGGGRGGGSVAEGGGGGGAGAILIASPGTIHIVGSITASGGNGSGQPGNYYNAYGGGGGGGSGGSIKLIANTIAGNGTVSAVGGSGGAGDVSGGSGGIGRVRFEAMKVTRTAATSPGYTYSYPSTVFVNNVPTLKLTSIGGVTVPESTSGVFGSLDIVLPTSITNPVQVTVSATNIPVNTQVTVKSLPEYGAESTTTAALSGTDASSTATANVSLSTRYQCIITAQATFTLQTAMYYEGEKIEKVRVATAVGKGQEVVYITAAGKEVTAQQMLASATK